MKWSAASTGDHIRGPRQTGYIKEHSAKNEKWLSSHVSSADRIQGFLQSRIKSAVMLSSLCQCPRGKASKENDRLAKWRNPQRWVRESEDGEDYDAIFRTNSREWTIRARTNQGRTAAPKQHHSCFVENVKLKWTCPHVVSRKMSKRIKNKNKNKKNIIK